MKPNKMKRLLQLFRSMAMLWPILPTMCLYVRAQQQENFAVSGKVISAASGVAIEGVTVTNKRTRIHAFTDRLGDYRIPARPDDILTYSFVGYVTAEEEIAGRERITVALDSAENTLAEVEINAGYYTTTRRTSTGNISRVTAEEIERQPVTNVLGALIGRMPGVNIVQDNGIAGGSFTVRIRGENSLREDGNQPLYIINGVPYPTTALNGPSGAIIPSSNPLNSLNPMDIESIEVLKDADATAIYGSRGANGVVLITTKKGAAQSSGISLQANLGFSRLPNRVELLDTRQYLEMRNEAFRNDNIQPTAGNAPDLMVWDTTRYTDWQQVLLGGTGKNTNLNGSLAGSSGNVQYLVGAGYAKETSIFPGDYAFERGSGNLSTRYTSPKQRFEFQATVNYTASRNTLPTSDLVSLALRLPPNAPEPYSDGGINWANGTWDNPFVYMERRSETITDNLLGSADFRYRLSPGLFFKASLSYNELSLRETELSPEHTWNPATSSAPTNVSTFFDNMERGYSIEPQLRYQHEIAGGDMQYLVGLSFQEIIRSGRLLNASGFSAVELMEQLDNAQTLRGYSSYGQYRYHALFGRANYSLKGRYLINLTFRRDGSSRFGPGKQWGNFGAAGLAWVFSEEPFLKHRVDWFSFGKARMSYGVTGSDQIGDYGYMDTYQAAGTYMRPGIRPVRLANSQYGWEVNRKFEAGIEAGFFQDRVRATASYYRNRSSSQLIGYQLPDITGFPSVQANFPATVQNTGYEFELDGAVLSGPGFFWRVSANLTLPYNRLVAFPDIENSSYSHLVVGKSRPLIRGYVFSEVDAATGVYTFRDIDDSGTVSSADRVVLDQPTNLFGGVGNSLTMGALSLDIFLQARRQSDFGYRAFFGMPGIQQNQPVEVMNRWKGPGDITEVARFSRGSATPYNRWRASDAYFSQDRSYLRLRNVSLVYRLPSRRVNRMSMGDVALHIQAQNLLTFTRHKGLDPESMLVPPLRTIIAGVKITL